jgi:hypothetical protein
MFSLPFLVMFAVGYFYVGFLSLYSIIISRLSRGNAPAALKSSAV